MGSRYLFICLYIWLEKYLSRDDYRRRQQTPEIAPREKISSASRV
jgi:dolichol-phosphate mannosyltransferase